MSRGMGIAAEGESLVVSAATTCTSSLCWLSWLDGSEGDDSAKLEFRDIERTTSFLQIGHVRRRVVNHGVLRQLLALKVVVIRRGQLTCTRHEIHDRTVDS